MNARLAQSKGRSGLNWWLVSLLLGPIATLLIVAWPRGDAEPVAGRMTWQRAVVIGLVIIAVVVVVVLGATYLGPA